jgi:hypothetical protein
MAREQGLELFMSIKRRLGKKKKWSQFMKDMQGQLEPGNTADSFEIQMEAFIYILEKHGMKLSDTDKHLIKQSYVTVQNTGGQYMLNMA